MCLNKPIQIPTGTNGASVYIAYASDSAGTGFSYIPSETRDYISFVTKKGAIAQADFTTWTLFQGNDGTNGTNGTSVSNVYVSDGVTAIGGTVYAENTVLVLLSTGTYINAGTIDLSLTWNDFTLLNGWISTGATPDAKAAYAIGNGFLYVRGTLDGTSATSDTFATIGGLGMASGSISGIMQYASTTWKTFTTTSGGLVQINSRAAVVYLLDTVPPISIR